MQSALPCNSMHLQVSPRHCLVIICGAPMEPLLCKAPFSYYHCEIIIIIFSLSPDNNCRGELEQRMDYETAVQFWRENTRKGRKFSSDFVLLRRNKNTSLQKKRTRRKFTYPSTELTTSPAQPANNQMTCNYGDSVDKWTKNKSYKAARWTTQTNRDSSPRPCHSAWCRA